MTHFRVYDETDGLKPLFIFFSYDSITAQEDVIRWLKKDGVTDPIEKNGFDRVVIKSGDGPYDYKKVYFIDVIG